MSNRPISVVELEGTLYKAQIRPSLEYCSRIWGAAAPTTLSILDAVQKRAIRLIGDPALTCHLQPPSRRRAVEVVRAHRGQDGWDTFIEWHPKESLEKHFWKGMEERGIRVGLEKNGCRQ
nr:unnamed protein product [Callosobruchus chinensis]